MDKKTGVIIGAIVAVFLMLGAITVWQASSTPRLDYSTYDLAAIQTLTDAIDYNGYDFTTVIPADKNSGGLAENVTGDADAPVLIFEYADYQCEHCAAFNTYINDLVEKYDGKVAVVFRSYVLSYHENGVRAAAAANAAALQGYWKAYKDLLFANQNDWFYATEAKCQELFEKYFEQVTGGKGDLEKFREDMTSEAVAQKIAFDRGVGAEIDIPGTPAFYLNGEQVVQSGTTYAGFFETLSELIEAELKK